jgi:hypothetical protein
VTKRDRVIASIRHHPTDVIPWQFDLTSAAAQKLKAYYDTDDVLNATGDHFVTSGYGPGDGSIAEAAGQVSFVTSSALLCERRRATSTSAIGASW